MRWILKGVKEFTLREEDKEIVGKDSSGRRYMEI